MHLRALVAVAALAGGILAACEPTSPSNPAGTSLLLRGTGSGGVDRVEIPVDPATPADVGATDFTIELWLRGTRADNPSTAASCTASPGSHDDWIVGNVVVDRDRWVNTPPLGRDFGISLSAGRVVFGVANDADDGLAICSDSDVLDGTWHHVAVQRRTTGRMEIWVDGRREASALGAPGDVSFPDGAANGAPKDPYLVLGAEKHDAGPAYPSFKGRVDEVRISTGRRYRATFALPTLPFTPDGTTAALYHFDGPLGRCTGVVADATGATPGACRFGGSPGGPRYVRGSAV